MKRPKNGHEELNDYIDYLEDLENKKEFKYIQVLNHCLNDALVVPQTKIKKNKMHSNGIAEFINDWYKKNFI